MVSSVTVYRLDASFRFPPPSEADPDGLLAVGGDLEPERIVRAYERGIFPWPHSGFPLLWFSPDPRMVLVPSALHVSRRLRRTLRSTPVRVTLDRAFADVVDACATVARPDQDGTWITTGMRVAYRRLFDLGHTHSVEAWIGDELVGGLYGVAVGGVFVGESMFAHRPDASKVAFVRFVEQLRRWGAVLFDAQVHTPHVERFGATEWPRERYLRVLRETAARPLPPAPWRLDPDLTGN